MAALQQPQPLADVAPSPVECLEWLLDPIDLKTFFSEYWETKPLLIRRKNRQRFKGLFSSQQLDDVIRSNYIKYGVNIDMARYSDGVRTTENPEGRVHANTMWALYEDGCSIRMLNPQTYAKPVWQLISTLQEYFQCMVGCNTYLTPPGAQGFAPHYDDIEALILQLEGSKRWRLYNNPTGERLPRTSSRNFDQSELSEPILDVVLQPGDFLYFPRGMAHQAVSTPDEHSLHITLSTYQLFDWAEYFKKLVPAALDYAIAEDAEFREGLPLQALNHVGLLHSETEGDNQRKRFMDKAKHLFQKLIDVAPYDSAADAVAVDFLHASMPSYLTSEELALTSRQKQLAARSNPVELSSPALAPSDWIRLIRPSMCRLVADSPEIVLLYHNQDNAMVWHEEEPQSLEFPVDFAPALEQLLLAQDFVRVDRLPELDEA
ncbi:uncharacterized protein MONBRDRAFT_25525 [Monosiga brevicollis MX1]|uniref:Bifunctional lysine-specific demethylase and histidyl-hydroxylase n=1 Tax=Monosiga brevicollis TaxID=81824 RepID=A9UZN8_MONBE|nr:uncharacterized protein MONBRDRAFT_25525 [Monosiga brevicollis MX1]EDQ89400.1 predicted protein [Monosiga brevicollis MX1]|eukprot:XP_001745976.1 hypothetical protein [Monosiga brevicollis MX1]